MRLNSRLEKKLVKNFVQQVLGLPLAAAIFFGCSPTFSTSKSLDVASQAPPNAATAVPPAPITNPVGHPVAPIAKMFAVQIKNEAGSSSCAQFSFANRGHAPKGYINGMALSYARSLCRIKAPGLTKPAASVLDSVNSRNPSKDVLAYYQNLLSPLGFITDISGTGPLEATYTVGIGLGMRESSGQHCEGWDTGAGSNRTSDEAEAGLFQVSYNSVTASAELKKLYAEYQADPSRCMLDVFSEGVSCSARSILGTGAGAEYQKFNKVCPAFAAEYAMTLVRVLRTHFGPLNRKEAQVVPECQAMLSHVRQIVELDPETVCSELF